MKKFVGIFIMVMFVFVMVSALGESQYDVSWCDARTYLDEWMLSQKGMETYEQTYMDGSTYHSTGVLSNADFREVCGEDFSPEKMEDVYLNAEKYDNQITWHATEVSVKLIGMYEQYNVYELNIKTNNPLTTYNGEKYYEAAIIFMVCE